MMPAPQAQLLRVWDRLGVPHKESKQVSGNPLTIIGISVDTTTMTLTLPDDARMDLLQELDLWCDEAGQLARKGATLKRWQQLAGWLNWAFNVFPHLRPCLANVYAKMRGKSVPTAKIRINNAVRNDLTWARGHLSSASGVHLLECAHWDPHEDADLTVFCDASLEGMGFWIRGLNLGFYAPTVDTQGEEFIFLHESLCVLSALKHIDSTDFLPSHTTIYSDNSNTVDIYNTLKASPRVNPILKAASDIALESCSDFKVLFIPGVLSYDGVEAQKREGKGKAGGYGSGFGGGGKAGRVCDRFNQKGGCERADGMCRFRHACRKCGKPGHGETACKSGGSKEA
ncbi:hypothetical protein D9611_001136 [Ephemerocybe angulata]|uniref:C3H1-type domain-containing protein n=1 Tax=Ephemerocybe angulata TaxID=980116 RepID=A0A8H5CHK1_9AGAR|nr:hypothetical protein D9611_001136 [Tulosesus angulatus]